MDGIGTLHQPTLAEIRDMGFETYYNHLSLIAIDIEQLAKLLQLPEEVNLEGVVPFDIFSINKKTMDLLLNSLRPFFADKLEFSEKHKTILSISSTPSAQGLGTIDRENFVIVKNAIMEISRIAIKEPVNKKPMSETAKRISEQLAKGRAKMEAAKKKTKTKDEERSTLWNIIGAVAACSKTYNLLNIWELTVAQLYDQFARINNEFYLNIMATRWCAWGEDKFEHDPWFSVPEE